MKKKNKKGRTKISAGSVCLSSARPPYSPFGPAPPPFFLSVLCALVQRSVINLAATHTFTHTSHRTEREFLKNRRNIELPLTDNVDRHTNLNRVFIYIGDFLSVVTEKKVIKKMYLTKKWKI